MSIKPSVCLLSNYYNHATKIYCWCYLFSNVVFQTRTRAPWMLIRQSVVYRSFIVWQLRLVYFGKWKVCHSPSGTFFSQRPIPFYLRLKKVLVDGNNALNLYLATILWLSKCQPIKSEWYESNRSLQWRHDESSGVSSHQPHDCLLSRLFRRRSKKIKAPRHWPLLRGIHRWPVNSPHKWPVTRKMFPFPGTFKVTWM